MRNDEDDDDSATDRSAGKRIDSDADFDNDRKRVAGYFDPDDGSQRSFGRAATPAEGRAIAAVVRQYFIAANMVDGATACRLMYFILSGVMVEDFGSSSVAPYLRGKTCAAVAGKYFSHYRAQVEDPTEIVAVRVEGPLAVVLLGSAKQPASSLEVRRERGRWKIANLLPIQLP